MADGDIQYDLEAKLRDAFLVAEWSPHEVTAIVDTTMEVVRKHYHDTEKHVVRITHYPRQNKWEWNLQHPLACRTGGIDSLMACEVNALLVEEGPLEHGGTYEVVLRHDPDAVDGISAWLDYSPVVVQG